MKPLIVLLLFCVSHLQAENSRGVESNLISLAEMVVPHIDMSDGATLSEAVDYLNLLFRAPDPPPPTSWKIRLDAPQHIKGSKVFLKGKNLRLHQVLGKIADQVGADVEINKTGYILYASNNPEKQNKSK